MNLHDAIDQGVFNIDDNQYTDSDLQAMSVDELETLKLRINKKISGLSAALREKQIEYSNGGKGAEKEWYMNRKIALSINQRVITYVNSLIRNHRRLERNISDYFMEQAKIVLAREDFELILSKAQREKENREGHYAGNNGTPN
jgi:hypothetical protein